MMCGMTLLVYVDTGSPLLLGIESEGKKLLAHMDKGESTNGTSIAERSVAANNDRVLEEDDGKLSPGCGEIQGSGTSDKAGQDCKLAEDDGHRRGGHSPPMIALQMCK
ncbi:hypothetical protein DHEL01_v206504 [Diaporthe helianthi]|uniref:Uncharacterized protein n=1 Tax=Diaporthe helianthi TaxID=158607 RepID=A0A2P5HXY0_DIAHE|nr:hypothetical protein DHEL01_v206504 [Diaporthe helianthi]